MQFNLLYFSSNERGLRAKFFRIFEIAPLDVIGSQLKEEEKKILFMPLNRIPSSSNKMERIYISCYG